MKRYLDVSGPRKVMSESKDTTGSKDSGIERNKGPCTSKGSPPLKTGMDIEDAGPSSSRETTFYEHMHDDCMDDTDDTETKGRLEWGLLKTKKFLSVYKENKDAMGTSRNKKKVWEKIANDLSTADKSTVTITGDQARDRFYTLKRKYRKYISESNKTGNKAPKPFLFEKEMQEILHDDPTFKPVCSIGSLRSKEAENDTGEENSNDNKDPPQKKMKKTYTKNEDLKAFLVEREANMIKAMKEIQASQNSLLEKILDKLQ